MDKITYVWILLMVLCLFTVTAVNILSIRVSRLEKTINTNHHYNVHYSSNVIEAIPVIK